MMPRAGKVSKISGVRSFTPAVWSAKLSLYAVE